MGEATPININKSSTADDNETIMAQQNRGIVLVQVFQAFVENTAIISICSNVFPSAELQTNHLWRSGDPDN